MTLQILSDGPVHLLAQQRSETTEMGPQMLDGVLRMGLLTGAAENVGRKWNVDCSPANGLRRKESIPWLRDQLALYVASNAALTPCYYKPRKADS